MHMTLFCLALLVPLSKGSVMDQAEKSASLESLEFPWEKRAPQRHIAHVPPQETGRVVTFEGFFMCLIAVLLFANGLLILGVVAWNLTEKSSYMRLIKMNIDLIYISIPAGLLCFPGCSTAITLHNRTNNYEKFPIMPLLMMLETISMLLLIAGTYMGLSAQNSPDNPNRILHENINKTLMVAFRKFGTDSETTADINKLQMKLKCCGVDDFNDFRKFHKINQPGSCCEGQLCNFGNTHRRGCKDSLMRTLYWHTNVLSSINLMGAIIQVFCLLMTITMCFNQKCSERGRKLQK